MFVLSHDCQVILCVSVGQNSQREGDSIAGGGKASEVTDESWQDDGWEVGVVRVWLLHTILLGV